MQHRKRGPGWPDSPSDVINKYGTYEVQDTTETDNAFPTIGYEGSGQACVDAANKEIKKKTSQDHP